MFAFLSGSRRYLLFLLIALIIPTIASAQPSSRSSARFVWDETQNKGILFGGLSPAEMSGIRWPLGDTWEWNGQRWLQAFPLVAPAPRFGHVMYWDTNRDRIVLFGGGSRDEALADNVLSDTWMYVQGVWTQLSPPVSAPPRKFSASAFDHVRDKLVMYGGIETTEWLYDTWEFDGTTWRQVATTGPKLKSPLSVYDAQNGEVLLLGINEKDESEMYRYIPEGTWEQVKPTNLPKCVAGGMMTFMEHTRSVILVGGACATPTDDTFEWNGTDWRDLDPQPSMGYVTAHSLVYDPIRQEMVVYGGTEFGERSQTYRFRDNSWRITVDPPFTPAPRSLMVFEADPSTGVIWMFGGFNDAATYFELWKLSAGTAWQKVETGTPKPSGCTYPVGTFDENRGRLVVVCEDASTYEWNGVAWTVFDGLKTKPDFRRWSSMLYNPETKKSYLFGGFDDIRYKSNVWIWDGTTWTNVDPKVGPKNRMLATFFWDPKSKRMLMYGGIGRESTEDRVERFGDMWAFDGTKWTELKPATLPPARYGAIAKYDPSRDKVIMFGGKSAEERYLNEQWEWDGANWAKVTMTRTPDNRMNFGLAFDPTLQRMTIYGGWAGYYFSDRWYLSGNSWQPVAEPPARRRIIARPATTTQPSWSDRLRSE